MKRYGLSMKNAVTLSVIIPVYNAEKYLPACLESLLYQGIQEMEIICIDDGSTDGSLKLLQKYASNDHRIQVVAQKNLYAGTARNKGMQIAQGSYIAFLDADDFYFPGALRKLYNYACKYKLDFVKGSFVFLENQTGRTFVTGYAQNGGVPHGRVCRFIDRPVRFLNAADVPWNGLYKHSFLKANKIEFNSLRCINDHSFYIHCLLCAERMMFVQTRTVSYRVNRQESLVGQRAEHFEMQLENYRIVRQLCEQAESALAEQILRCELNGIMEWHARLRPARISPGRVDEQLRLFLHSFVETDVGSNYLQTFPFRDTYYMLRYGCPPPGQRPPLPVRLLRCWQEHGCRYMLDRAADVLRRKR